MDDKSVVLSFDYLLTNSIKVGLHAKLRDCNRLQFEPISPILEQPVDVDEVLDAHYLHVLTKNVSLMKSNRTHYVPYYQNCVKPP